MNNLALAIEFDEELDDVVEFTVQFLRDETRDPVVHVVHVYQPQYAITDYTPYLVDPFREYDKNLREQARAVHNVGKQLIDQGIQAHAFMKPLSRNVAHSILEFAAEKKADLIVVGTHHPGKIERFILGSTSQQVVRKASIPVAVVPRKVPKS